MTTHELARLLLAGPDVRVVVDGYEQGLDEPHIRPVVMREEDSGDYGGVYTDVTEWGDRGDVAVGDVVAVCISRKAETEVVDGFRSVAEALAAVERAKEG